MPLRESKLTPIENLLQVQTRDSKRFSGDESELECKRMCSFSL